MKIGQFCESFLPIYDGVSRVVKAYADTLSEKKQEVYVITPMDDSGFRGQYPFEIVDYDSVKIPLKMPYRVGEAKLDSHFLKRMKQIDLDICHAHGPAFAGHYGLYYAKKKHIPIVGTFHTKFYDDVLKVTHNKTLATLGAKTVADFYSKCDEVWAVSESSGETLREYGYKGEIIVMPNGTNKRMLNKEKLPSVIKKYKINTEKTVLLFVGQINFKKNLKMIIDSCGTLKKENLDFQLVFCGRGPDEDDVKKLIKANNLQGNFIFTGHILDIEELDCIYSLADLFLFPSIYDTFGLVIREAACQHAPSLVLKGSSAAEGIINNQNGLVAENNVEDITRVIKDYISLPQEEKARIRQSAYNTIPIAWNGPLMDEVIGRYKNLIDMKKYQNRKGL